ncbi:RNA polymerase sigma factor [Actinoallomurus soli]|uniref:RNA polymerase sigma factor n=1 Tax=Actinoallomurus soli TaxID=2952535 RepID=UPI00209390AC|nr:RNA polymerase sigma factor [Actinoallomurus soli]MCO5969160.1 RNA polymerase sigma factor [Actinoallomurus soli]
MENTPHPGTREVTDGEAIAESITDPERFSQVFDRHWDAIHRYVVRRLGPEVAEDVSAETFIVAFRARGRYDLTRPDARPWLFGIATNLIGEHRRAERRRQRALAQANAEWTAVPFDEGSDARVTAQRLGPRIAAALTRLSAAERDLLLLIAWADLTYEEAAQALDLPLGTVRSRLHRVRGKLRRAFGGIDPSRLQEEFA